jgi:hypothetical protein
MGMRNRFHGFEIKTATPVKKKGGPRRKKKKKAHISPQKT